MAKVVTKVFILIIAVLPIPNSSHILSDYNIMKSFKTIPDYPNYAINKNGEVFNKRLQIIMKSRFDTYGYKRINLSKHNEKKTYYLHQLVAKTYLPNENNYPCVDHINAIRDDNRLENLRWCSWVQNHWFRFWPNISKASTNDTNN